MSLPDSLPPDYEGYREHVLEELRFDIQGLLEATLVCLPAGYPPRSPADDTIVLLNHLDPSPKSARHMYGWGDTPPDAAPPEIGLVLALIVLAEDLRNRPEPAARRLLQDLQKLFRRRDKDLDEMRLWRARGDEEWAKIKGRIQGVRRDPCVEDQRRLLGQAELLAEEVADQSAIYLTGRRGPPERLELTSLELALRKFGGYTDTEVVKLVHDGGQRDELASVKRLRKRRQKAMDLQPSLKTWGRR